MSTTELGVSLKLTTQEFRQFWDPVLKECETAPYFTAKLSYKQGTQDVVRLFPSELSKGNPVYLEMVNFSFEFLGDQRVLYRLPYRKNWKDLYTMKGADKTATYEVPASMMEIVNVTPVSSATPFIAHAMEITSSKVTPSGEMDLFDEDSFTKLHLSEEDAHQSAETIRDHYCITNQVPMSNKPWLNNLIIKGREWLKKQQ